MREVYVVGDRGAKDRLFDGFADVAKALASGRRIELIDVLEQGERHVDQLAAELGQTIANTSFHLRALATAGLVTTRRDGNRIYYRLSSPRVAELWSALRDVTTTHHAELDSLAAAYLGDRSGLEEICRTELARRLEDGNIIVIDVRPTAEYEAGHITGARSIPIESIQHQIADLPEDTEFVAYCRGPFCVYADDAIRQIQARGHQARRLEDGFPQWQHAGLPTTVGL